LYRPRGPGGGPGGGGPHGQCSNCSPKPPPTPPPTKPHTANAERRDVDKYSRGGGGNPYERGLPPLYRPRGPGGGPGGGPHTNCSNCTAPKPSKPPKPPKPNRTTSALLSADLRVTDDNPFSRGLPPLYHQHGPGGGPHGNCSNCQGIDPKPGRPKPKPKP
jgi:hypothetical protein